MKLKLVVFNSLLLMTTYAFGYEGPMPLKDIKVEVETTVSSSGLYQYKYHVINPAVNDGEINSVDIFLDRNPETEESLSSEGLTHCPKHSKTGDAMATQRRPGVPVGSTAPKDWSCGYGTLANYPSVSYSWGAGGDPSLIKPGKSTEFTLTSFGVPAIREILIQPDIDLERLPPEYNENVEKTVELENKVKWMGKTIGPKAPPKVFNATQALQGLNSAIAQAVDLGWLKDKVGWRKSLEAKLEAAKKKIESGDKKAAKNILGAFLSELDAQKNKQLSSEAYALLYFNGKYLISKL
jgi:hypothetical protein